MKAAIGTWRSARLAEPLARAAAFYARERSSAEIRAHQLAAFNAVWADVRRRSPHYRELARACALPERFASFAELAVELPLLERSAFARAADRFALEGARRERRRVTGGSTAEPVSIPASRAEDRANVVDTWLARSWYGVTPADSLFLLWGHSHLLGSGPAGAFNRWMRRLKDRGCGYLRVSAYDLGDRAMRRAGRALLAQRPSYLIGYSVALHRLAHVNRDLAPEFRALGLKVAIATAESFPTSHSAELIADTFACPVSMEYGAVETGLIAHRHPEGRFRVFWASHHVETLPAGNDPARREIAVTALYPRVVPLIRYRLGDLVQPDESTEDGVVQLAAVVGRCNDIISLDGGARVHSEAFSHVLRDVREIQAFQVVRDGPRAITINYIADSPLPASALTSIHSRLSRVDAGLADASLVRVSRLEETIAGKTKRIIDRGAAATAP